MRCRKHVGVHGLRAKARPLEYAEPVLLVDDDEPELLKDDVALHERVRAHHEMNCSRLHVAQDRPARG